MPLAGSGWPVPDEARDGWWPGLPYLLHDMRPQGYMGRLFARAEHHALGVAPDPQAWSDDDMLPMLHAPLPGGEVPMRTFEPPLPLPPQCAVWHAAWSAARDFWRAAADDGRVSATFCEVCAAHADQLSAAAVHA
ncbi:hypothetical protein GCM10022279_18570 [Comamonas faecalis]|uniref:Uncharacterized protein n=2 Tax=Comamonas faecalis TaxID=1387849 RepID=A0ABP7RBC5_9BURK